ncbi:hypothetical protein ERX37_06860 [Macrococcus hajekii]|uniref:Uncharacterized protein n=1 Tax=Macrococcus hajekii TaxID=198482 RepID=A0A4R6BJN3_9STAP|nr:hypothetical protein [Macrococcus hajekii]TDM01925.1 hypothetical protein ERX37_06860 [Macrococcus hajekii]GGB08600.1 hypothetical protein GCM10007190_15750 [Macrococcus hajekii]
MENVLAYYLLNLIEKNHRNPLTYNQINQLTVHALSDIEVENFTNEMLRLQQENLILCEDVVRLTFSGKVILDRHHKKQQLKSLD